MLPITQKWTSFLFMVVLGIALLLGHYKDAPPPAPPLLTNGTFIIPRALPSFKWQASDGKVFTNENLKGRYTLIYWGYRQCPTICLPTLQLMAKIKASRPKEPLALLLVNIDPNEAPSSLSMFLKSIDPAFIGILGSNEQLTPVAKRLGIYTQTNNSDGHHLEHGGQIFMTNPDGECIAIFSPPLGLAPILNDIDGIIRYEHDLKKQIR